MSSENEFTPEDVLQILFDSFEMSRGSNALQALVFHILALKFPDKSFPNTPDDEIIEEFLSRTKAFLTQGKFHVKILSSTAQTTAAIELQALRIAFAQRDATSVTIENLRQQIFNYMIRRDLRYLSPAHTESNIKKYFIDELVPKNFYSRAVIAEVRPEYEKAVQSKNLKNRLLRLITHRLDKELDLFRLAWVWEQQNPGKSFWNKTERIRRM